MRILFLCHRFPLPPEGGGKIRALQIVRHLVERGDRVTLCSLLRSDSEARAVSEMERLGARVEAQKVVDWIQVLRMVAYAATRRPSSFGYFYSSRLARRIRALLQNEQWDLILVHCSSMGGYVAAAGQVPKIMDFADMDSQKWSDYAVHKPFPFSLAFALEAAKLAREERRFAQSFDYCTTISANELETLHSLGGAAASAWFPNGVDLDYFQPGGDDYDPDLIVFVGRMDYYPNEQAMCRFCADTWPALKSARPSLKLRIVGADPPRSIRRIGKVPGVEVTGSVPDVRPHLLGAAISIAPLTIARGMQNKVLECMAMGIPVVTTERVANGLGLGPNSPLSVARTPEDFVREICSILEDPARRLSLARSSRLTVEQRFSWVETLKGLDGIIDSCVSSIRDARMVTEGQADVERVRSSRTA